MTLDLEVKPPMKRSQFRSTQHPSGGGSRQWGIPNNTEDGVLIPTSARGAGNIPFDPGVESDSPTGQHRDNTVVDTGAGQGTIDGMNLICWNCRGVGRTLSSNKMQYLAKLMSSTKATITFVSETLSSKINSHDLVNRFPICDSFVVPAEGHAGGLWIMWADDIKLEITHSNQHVVLASVVNTTTSFSFSLICVYGDPHHRKTKDIWKLIDEFVSSSPGKPVYCMGDFNDILYPMEKNGPIVSNHHRMVNFSNHVKRCGLIDMGYHGPAFTWCNKRFTSLPVYERLDRCFANAEWCIVFPNTAVYNLPIMYSDHPPILTITKPTTMKTKRSFKFENWWLLEEDYHDTAKNNWTNTNDKPFHVRTALLAGSLKRWSRSKRPLNQQLEAIHNELGMVQSAPPHLQDHVLEANLIEQYDSTMTKLTEFCRQRAKRHWATKGDRNTTYFHNSVLKRRRKNRISVILDHNNNMLHNPDDIASCFINYFSNLFSSCNPDLGTLPLLSNNEEGMADCPSIPDKEEILQVLKGMKRNASPGPDGLNVAFYISAWKWIGDDVTKLVQDFYTRGKFHPQLNKTYIALIPKKANARTPQDFRPISLCNVVYKIITKTLANRLKDLLPDYIHESQQAFIQGRRIANNIIVAQEISHSFQLTSWKHKAFMLKLDLAKAFDIIEWSFIRRALLRKGLHSHFVDLIYECISSATFAVNINGQPFGNFRGSRGIRQGCPLSPYLFILAVNELSMSMQEALNANHLSGIQLGPSCPPIHSLFFADDLIVCGRADNNDANTIARIFNQFCAISGQTPNWNKSAILFSKHTDNHLRSAIKNIFPAPDMNLNTLHLGHPLILPGKKRAAAYNFIIDKFRAKLNSYKANRLSHAGRLTLIKSVFASLPVYYMSTILLSKGTIAKLTSIVRKFWWTGIQKDNDSKPICFRAWDDICKPMHEGGLGIRDLSFMNKSLVATAAWRIIKNPSSLVAKILKAKYFHNTSIWKPRSSVPRSAFWASVLKIVPLMHDSCQLQIANGDTCIWTNPWCKNWRNIHDHLNPNLEQPCPKVISDLWQPNSKLWDVDKISTFFDESFKNEILNIPIINADFNDTICWTHTPSADCTTKSAYKTFLQDAQVASSGRSSPISDQEIATLNQVWKNKSIAPRVKTFAWRLIRRALASGFRASRYSMHIKKECCRCGQLETDSHLFFHCNFARSVWFNFGLKTDALDTNLYPSAVIRLILSAQHLDLNIASIFTILWNIWKARNDFLFKQRTWTPLQVVYATRAMLNVGLMEKSEEDSRASTVTHPKNKLPCKNLSLQPAGFLAYVDAAFNPAVARNEASFGVFLRNEDNNHSIFIQAMALNVFSVLQAEAMGLLLAASTAKTLGWNSISFLSDCRTLVDAAEARNLLENPGHWRIRPILAEFFNIVSRLNSYKVTHIPRIKNMIAHSLAKKAFLHRSSSCCSFLCSKGFRCNLKMAYDAISFPLGKILTVHCLGC